MNVRDQLGVTALDMIRARELSRESGRMTAEGAMRTTRSIAINRPRARSCTATGTTYGIFPRFMYHLESVIPTGEQRSHWVTRGPAGKR